MERDEIERLRERVSCAAALEQAGFGIDLKESTHRAIKYRRGGAIVIVTHGGKGWFDPLSDRKGDLFALVGWLQACDFRSTLAAVAALEGYLPEPAVWKNAPRKHAAGIAARWSARMLLQPGSTAFEYLETTRSIPSHVLRQATDTRLVHQGPFGSAWFAHHGDLGEISGWEERGPTWRGFSTGGTKTLFRFGNCAASRLCVTEAAIDALSLAALEGRPSDTLYTSTAGGWSRRPRGP